LELTGVYPAIEDQETLYQSRSILFCQSNLRAFSKLKRHVLTRQSEGVNDPSR
jgi:hypothetical protein